MTAFTSSPIPPSLSSTSFDKLAILYSNSISVRSRFLSISVFSSLPLLAAKPLTHGPATQHSQIAQGKTPFKLPIRCISNPGNAAASGYEIDSGGAGTERLVQHLVVKENDLRLLIEIEKRISQGEDLSDLATEHSICESKKNGGMIGWVRKGQLISEIEEAAFNNPLNKVARIKTPIGWHLVQALSEREERSLKSIKPSELHVKLKDPIFIENSQLIDVRETKEVEEASLPGFEVLPLSLFGSWGPEITSKFDIEKETYVLCQYGLRSLQIGKWLREQGFKRVFVVKGGIYEYALSADPSIPTY